MIGWFGMCVLAFRPFLEPLPIDRYWALLVVPLVIGISVTYKAIKMDRLEKLPREATALMLQILAFMVMAAAGVWLLTELI